MMPLLAGFLALLTAGDLHALAPSPAEAASTVAISADVKIPKDAPLIVDGTMRVQKGDYLRPPLGEAARGGVIVIEGQSDIVLDLRGVVLSGALPATDLDKLAGYGIVVRDCRNVTIQGGRIGGYGACVVVERSENVVLDGMVFDRWYGMRLLSTIAAENSADWLWPHENDEGQWLSRYGAAISLTDSQGVQVRNCRGRRGQNGILMLRCESARIFDNDFSFLSGWGLAMYRSSNNVVSRNAFDYCVRGYSHGVYWRGQDSAAILMFERCSDNLIAYNSATHSGDGLFLFAGRDIVEGRAFEKAEVDPASVGGSDRNLFYGNDFSYAVANGIEATFSSDNRMVANRIRGCHQHGIWGGYSRRNSFVRNHIEGTLGGAITVEHGQEILIAENVLHDNDIGVELYWDEDPDLVGGAFGKRFDTASRDHLVVRNSFSRNDSDFVVARTQGLMVAENVFESGGRELVASLVRSPQGDALESPAVRAMFSGIGGWTASGRIGDSTVSVPKLDAEHLPPSLALELEFQAPNTPGTTKPFDPSREGPEGLATIVMGEWGPWDFRSGDPKPVQRPPGGLLAAASWQAKWFSWRDGADPRGDAAALTAWRELAKEPTIEATISSWYTPHGANPEVAATVGRDRFGLIARTEVELPAGRYRLSVVSDDGVRMAIDGETVLENWTWHAPTRDTAEFELEAGRHAFLLEYFQIDGASALSVDLEALR